MVPEGFRPMLAAKDFDPAHLRYPIIHSPKLDGFRNLQTREGPRSRKLEQVPNLKVRAYFSRDELYGLDGEFLLEGENPFREGIKNATASVWSRIDGENSLILWVFDDFTNPELPFAERSLNTYERVKRLGDPRIKYVPHTMCGDVDTLMAAEGVYVAAGAEGIMVRDAEGRYKYGRATASYDRAARKEGRDLIICDLGKIKRFQDMEATIVDFVPAYANQNELQTNALGHAKRSTAKAGKVAKDELGAFVLSHPDYPKTFEVGTGFTSEQRRDFWARREQLRGKEVTFKYQPSGMKDVPQFNVFKEIRLD